MASPINEWRAARQEHINNPSVKTAAKLQRLNHELRLHVLGNLTIMEGGKDASSLRHRD